MIGNKPHFDCCHRRPTVRGCAWLLISPGPVRWGGEGRDPLSFCSKQWNTGATENLAASGSAKKRPARFPGRFVTLARLFGESQGFSLRGLCSQPEAPSGLEPPPRSAVGSSASFRNRGGGGGGMRPIPQLQILPEFHV